MVEWQRPVAGCGRVTGNPDVTRLGEVCRTYGQNLRMVTRSRFLSPSFPARPPPEQTDFLSLTRCKRRGSASAQDRKRSRARRRNSCKASRRVTPRQVCNQPAAVLCSPTLASKPKRKARTLSEARSLGRLALLIDLSWVFSDFFHFSSRHRD